MQQPNHKQNIHNFGLNSFENFPVIHAQYFHGISLGGNSLYHDLFDKINHVYLNRRIMMTTYHP